VDIKTMDPSLITDFYSQQAAMLEFPLLYVYDNNLNYTPLAAQSMPQISADGKTWTIKIKSGLKWTDGTAIDANTFVQAINRSADPCVNNGAPTGLGLFLSPMLGEPAYNSTKCNSTTPDNPHQQGTSPLIGQGKALYAPDPQTLVITLSQPASYFIGDLTTTLYSAEPMQLISQYGKNWTAHLTDGSGFGGGTFNLTEWNHQGKMVFKANTAEQQILDGTTSKLSEIDITIYKDPNTQYKDFQNGQQAVGFPPSADYATAKKASGFHQIPWLNMGYLAPTWTLKPFDNVLARQAFGVALNRQALATVLKNIVIPSCHIIPQGSLGYNPNLTCADNSPLTGDTAKAGQLMQQYADAACGGKIASCTPVTFVDGTSPDTEAVDAVIMAEWKAAFPDYPITLKNEDFNTLLTAVYGGNPPQIYGIGYSVDYNHPQDWTSLQFTAGENVQNVNDPQAQALFTAADADTNQADAISKYDQAEQILVNDGAWITLSQAQVIWNQAKNVQNFAMTSAGYPSPLMFDRVFLTNS
jgi:ABC-type oligopeptide transport system substrate-binding subunit